MNVKEMFPQSNSGHFSGRVGFVRPGVTKFDLIRGLARAFDLVSPQLAGHHIHVAYIAAQIAYQLGLDGRAKSTVMMAALVHDAGALHRNTRDVLKLLQFESDDQDHAEVGYRLLRLSPVFNDIAEIIRYHHCPWEDGKGSEKDGMEVPLASHIIHLADRVAVLLPQESQEKTEILSRVGKITGRVKAQVGRKFHPRLVEAFLEVSRTEYFWLDLLFAEAPLLSLADQIHLEKVQMNLEEIIELTDVFSQITDFQSRFTVTHSSGVAACARKLAELAGFSEEEQSLIEISGYLHDLGKLAVPREILEAPRKLTLHEMNIVKSHAYFTYQILKAIPVFEKIGFWAFCHHEKLDGTGYPFHLTADEMDLGCEIMGVADIFTALTEARPYRRNLTESEALDILWKQAKENSLNPELVDVLGQNLSEIDRFRFFAQKRSVQLYDNFIES